MQNETNKSKNKQLKKTFESLDEQQGLVPYSKYKVMFEVWKNPWISSKFGQIKWQVDEEPFDAYDVDPEQQLEILRKQELEDMMEPHVPFLATPTGPIPLLEEAMPEKVFKMWVGHTNFRLDYNLMDVLDNVSGVEALKLLTPYRFRLAIGKMFTDRTVMQDIKNSLISAIESK